MRATVDSTHEKAVDAAQQAWTAQRRDIDEMCSTGLYDPISSDEDDEIWEAMEKRALRSPAADAFRRHVTEQMLKPEGTDGHIDLIEEGSER